MAVVELTAIATPLSIELVGLDETQITALLESWVACGARLGDSTPDIRAVLGPFEAGHPRADVVATTFAELADRLTTAVTLAAIEARKTELLLLHAGAVADPATGHVVAYIGPSGRGKTTASAALSRHFSYVSDETVAIRDDLSVVAYPKPLSVKVPGSSWKEQRGPAGVPAGDLSLVTLVMLDRQPEYPADAAPTAERISIAESISELVPQISYLTERDSPLQRLRGIVDACGGLLRITYREAESLVPLVADLLAAGRPEAHEPPADYVDIATDAVAAAGEVVRVPVDDALHDGESLIVLNDGMVRVLSGIAPTIWEAARHPLGMDALLAAVVDAHGAPPDGDAAALVSSAVDDLVATGLIRRGQ